MAKINPSYMSGYKGSITVDSNVIPVMNIAKTNASVDSVDVTVNSDGGYSSTEAGSQTVKMSFTLPLSATATSSPIEVGALYTCSFSLNGHKIYEGPFLVVSVDINADVKGIVSLDVSVQNHGNVTPVVTP